VERESILKGFELGAQDYITKPFDSRELLVRVRTHLRLKDSIEELEILNNTLEEKVEERTRQLAEANDKLHTLNLKLLDLDNAKTAFLQLISHEIRTPLNGIIGPLELLKGPFKTDDISKLVEILDISVKRLEKFTLDALLITRLKTRPDEIKKKEIDLSAVLQRIFEENEEMISSKNLAVSVNMQDDTGIVTGEPELIEKCFENIIKNAIIYTPENRRIEVSLLTGQENEKIIGVYNDGPGFSGEMLENVFDLFNTGSVCQDNRLGIGLPIVKLIMEAHGGNVKIENSEEGGVSVSLIFR